ncbi:magnesium transporter [Desulfoluna butyratoxydans]|uniref:Magnesium transporter MgtE n=1 Tax=Desulfoluna butyratoxydans TaxID=231438 RepID=A0A4U8YQI1_9BACT|nr:magnesium transporter [Desulfoluna butyratoxydans]VFQ46506.1 magnesium transporter mgte [Desulfoluna butyratoxydans]
MKNPLLVPELRDYLESDNREALGLFLESGHPRVIADFLSALTPKEAWQILEAGELCLAAEIFSEMDDWFQADVAETLSRHELACLVTEMSPDDRVDLLSRIPENRRLRILSALAVAEREDIRKLSSYHEGSAGSAMTSDYATLSPDLTAADAIDKLRREAPDKETIYYAYVVDEERRLIGFASLKDLILAPAHEPVREIMNEGVISVRATDDQEFAARQIQKYGLIALPVINGGDALVGIITHDDAIDIITQEHTEDLEKFMAIQGSHDAASYLRTPALTHFRNRVLWVVGLAAAGLVSGGILHHFEATLSHLMILALYMPMLADTGGNTGSQSATVVIRALALGEITSRDILKVLGKEFKIALMLAAVLAGVAWIKIQLLSGGSPIPGGFTLPQVGGVIVLALSVQVLTSTLVGALLPMGAAGLRLDPAVVASPALTTVVDITGLFIYFTCARVLLGV